MPVLLAELTHLILHECNDAESQLLCFGRFSMMLAAKGDKRFCKTDEADAECSVVDHSLDGVVLSEFLAVKPQRAHKERELLLESSLLEVESFVQLLCRNVKCPVKFVEEFMYSVFLVRNVHALDRQLHDIDGSE